MIEGLRRPDAGEVTAARRAPVAAQRRSAAPDRRPAPGVVVLRAADHPRADPHLRVAVRRPDSPRGDEWLERVGLVDKAGDPDRGPVRRPAAAAVHRVRAGARPRGGLPRRADGCARPAGPAQPLGPAVGRSTSRAGPWCSPPTTWTRPRRCATGSRSWTTGGSSAATPLPPCSRSGCAGPDHRRPPAQLEVEEARSPAGVDDVERRWRGPAAHPRAGRRLARARRARRCSTGSAGADRDPRGRLPRPHRPGVPRVKAFVGALASPW